MKRTVSLFQDQKQPRSIKLEKFEILFPKPAGRETTSQIQNLSKKFKMKFFMASCEQRQTKTVDSQSRAIFVSQLCSLFLIFLLQKDFNPRLKNFNVRLAKSHSLAKSLLSFFTLG